MPADFIESRYGIVIYDIINQQKVVKINSFCYKYVEKPSNGKAHKSRLDVGMSVGRSSQLVWSVAAHFLPRPLC